jgi:hypothetical protein
MVPTIKLVALEPVERSDEAKITYERSGIAGALVETHHSSDDKDTALTCPPRSPNWA